MTDTLIKWGLRALAVVAIIGAIIFAYTNWRDSIYGDGRTAGKAEVQALWNIDTIKRQAAAAAAVNKARKEEQDKAALAAKNAKVEYENQKVAAVAVARSAAVTGGLSRYIAGLNTSAVSRGMPTVSSCPGEFVRERDAGILARQLLDQCSGRYQRLAETADGLGLKLDTALNYIAVVAPAAP